MTICLLATQVLAPDVAQAASLALLPAHNELSALEAWAPSALTGKVTARVLAENPRGVLIHIQDAHAVFEAQKNIEALLQEIKSAVPVKDIFLEGGVGLLDPKLKHFFPGGIRLEKEDRESWVREGQLTGAEAYLMGDEQVQGFGIEEDGRYWDNVELYRRVDAYRSQSADFLHAWYEVWQKEAGSYFKPALKKYLETYAAAQKEASGSAGWFDALRDYARSEWSRDLGALNEQVEFPMLARYWHLKKIDTTPDFVKVEDQKKEFFSAVKALDATENVLHEIDALVEKAKAGQIDFSGAREVFEQLAAYLPVDFSMARWPDLKTLIERIILAGEIDSDRLLIEAKRLHVQIIKKDAAGQKQRGLALLLEKQILLSKLLSLELAREDFQKILKHPARPEGLMRELLSFGLAGDQSFGFDKQQAADLSRVYEDAIHFYDGAIERESVMRQTILGKIKKDRVSVVVTGGFHARGMEAFAREQNWNYVAVMPRISKIQPEDFAHYRRALLGEGRARSEMSAPSEVAAALITSPQAMRDPHAAERVEAVLSLPGAEEALRRMESHAALRDDRNNARMQKVAAASREDEGFPEISLEEVSASKMRSETRLILPVPERPVYWAINGAGATGGEALKANYINDKWIRVLYDGAMNTRNEKAILRVINGIAPEKIPDFVERLKHHSTHGAFLAHGRPVEIETGKDNEGEEFPGTHWIRINGDKKIYVLNERGGVQTIPWGKFKIHTVIESTGKFKNTEAAAGHLSRSVTEKFYEGIVSREAVRSDDSGAQRVIISTGFDKELSDAPTIVMGSNQDELKQNAQHKITSNASCTTNCIAPLVQPFLKIFSNGLLMTVHAATNSQDPRSALRNISPAKTGAAKNIGLIFSAAKGKLDGAALRVPIANVSLSEVTLELKGRFSAEDVNAMLEQASENELSGILEYRGSEDLTSTKVMSSSASVVVQGNKTKTIVSEDGESTLVKLSGWYDNERGFSTRLIDHILYTAWVDEQVENGGIDLEGKKAELKKPKKTVEPLAPEEVPSLGNALEMPSFEGSVRTVISNGMTLSGKTLIRHILLTQPKLNLVAVNGVKGIASADAAARQKAAKAFIRWLQREDDSVKYRAEDAQKKLRSFEIKQGDFDGGQLTEGEGKLTWLVFNDQKILLLEQGGETKNLPWNFVKVDTVFETASKRGKTDLEGHLSAGARSVILTGAAEGVPVFQWGVNSVQQPSKTFVMSTGGAETGAMAPVLKFLHDFFGAKRAMFTGAVTVSDKDTALDGNLTAAAGVNIIPKESLAGNDVSHLIPGLAVKGSLNTVPNHDASALVVQVELGKTTTAAELNQYLKAASRSIYKGVFTYIDESDTASSQFVDAELPVIDLKQTIVAGGSLAQILIWTSREAFAKTASNLALSFAVQKARSEARPLPENLKQYLEQLKDENGRWPDSVAERAIPAIEEIMDRKERQLAKQSNLLKAMRESTDKVSREVPVIEQISESVWDDYNIKFLNLAVRVAYALAVFDSVNFPRVHAYLMEFVDKLQPQKNLMSSDRLGHPRDYAVVNNIFDRAEMELTVDENVMLRYAMNTLILQMPRYERRAMEKESLILEFVKERRQPGSGNIPAIVFLTDYHGSTRIGSLIGHAFGLKNYQNIHTPEELETRLAAEGIDPDKVNLLFIGGSDYVDRGPEPLSGFRFNQWLRKRGKLEFINGNHEWWKDWNILGLHFRVNDALRQVAENPNQTPEKAYEAVKSFVTLDKLSDEQKSMELAKVYGILKAFLENITKAGSDLEAAIQTTADLIISSGSNAQHSLEFWAREWYEHSQWADVFLDQLNAEIINEKIRKANRAIQAKHVQHLHLAIQYSGDKLSPEVKALLARNLDNGLLFEEISSAAFSKNSVVQETLKKNKKLKKENEEIRTANEQMALAGRFSELKPQHKVQTAFELTSAEAIKMADQINHAFEVLNETLKEVSDLHLDTGSLDLVTPENYRQNEVVRETANWDLKNMGLIFTDIYENFFVHGIIPITDDGKEFDVAYKGLHGVDAIERMQNDIRKFFEEHSDLNDSAESRALIWKHLGEAFGVINSWYSDTLAHLKPARIVKFKEKGGPAEFPYEYESSLSSRKFKGTKGMVHVGHVEAGKLRKADIPYWFGGMKGGLIHGDYEASEGSYAGLGAYISHFRRGPDGKLMGIRRFGYKETVAYYEKKLKEAREPKTGEPSAELIAKIEADLKRVRTTGDTVSDLTLDPEDLSGEEKANAEPLMDGNNLVDYYVIRFLEENIESYEKLRQGAVKRGFEARAAHYEAKRNWSKEYLEQYRQLIGRSEARAPISGPESTNRSESRVAEAVEFAIKNKRNLSAELLAKDIDALLDRGGKSFNPKDYLHVVRDLYARGEPDLADQLAVLFRDNLAQMREIRSVINLSETYLLNYSGSAQVQEFMQALIWIVEQKRINRLKNFSPEDPSERREGEYIDRQFKSIQKKLKDLIFEWTGVAADEKAEMFTNYESKYHLDWLSQGESDWSLIEGAYAGDFIRSTELKIYESLKAWLLTSKDLSFYSLSQRRQQEWMNGIESFAASLEQKEALLLSARVAAKAPESTAQLLAPLVVRFSQEGYSIEEETSRVPDLLPALITLMHQVNHPWDRTVLQMLLTFVFSVNSGQSRVPTDHNLRVRTRQGLHGVGLFGVIRDEIHNYLGIHAAGLLERLLTYYLRFNEPGAENVLFDPDYSIGAFEGFKKIPRFNASYFPRDAVDDHRPGGSYDQAAEQMQLLAQIIKKKKGAQISNQDVLAVIRAGSDEEIQSYLNEVNKIKGADLNLNEGSLNLAAYLWAYREIIRRYSTHSEALLLGHFYRAMAKALPFQRKTIFELKLDEDKSFETLEKILKIKKELYRILDEKTTNYSEGLMIDQFAEDYGRDDNGNADGGATIRDERFWLYRAIDALTQLQRHVAQKGFNQFAHIDSENLNEALAYQALLVELGFVDGWITQEEKDHAESLLKTKNTDARLALLRLLMNQEGLVGNFYKRLFLKHADEWLPPKKEIRFRRWRIESPFIVKVAEYVQDGLINVLKFITRRDIQIRWVQIYPDYSKRNEFATQMFDRFFDRKKMKALTEEMMVFFEGLATDMEKESSDDVAAAAKKFYIVDPSDSESMARIYDNLGRLELGSKGIGLVRMAEKGISVPPFIIFPAGMAAAEIEKQMPDAVQQLELVLGKKKYEYGTGFAAQTNPVFFAVRASSYLTLPGLAWTATNSVMADEMDVRALSGRFKNAGIAEDEADWMAWDSFRRFWQDLGEGLYGIKAYEFDSIIDAAKKEFGVVRKEQFKVVEMQAVAVKYRERVYAVAGDKEQVLQNLEDNGNKLKLLGKIASGVKTSIGLAQKHLEEQGLEGLARERAMAVVVMPMVYANFPNFSGKSAERGFSGIFYSQDPNDWTQRRITGELKTGAQGADLADHNSENIIPIERAALPAAIRSNLVENLNYMTRFFRQNTEVEVTFQPGASHHQSIAFVQARSAPSLKNESTFRANIRKPLAIPLGGIGAVAGAGSGVVVPLHKALKMNQRELRKILWEAYQKTPRSFFNQKKFFRDVGVILIADSLDAQTLSQVRLKLPIKGLITSRGGYTSHTADAARDAGIPLIARANIKFFQDTNVWGYQGHLEEYKYLHLGNLISVDGTLGKVYSGAIPLEEGAGAQRSVVNRSEARAWNLYTDIYRDLENLEHSSTLLPTQKQLFFRWIQNQTEANTLLLKHDAAAPEKVRARYLAWYRAHQDALLKYLKRTKQDSDLDKLRVFLESTADTRDLLPALQARSETRLPEKPEWLGKKEESNWQAIYGENGFLDSLNRKVQQSRNVQQLLNDSEILIVMPVAYEISPDRTSNLIDDLQDYARHQTGKKVKIIAVAEHDSSTARKLEIRKDENFQILYKDENDKGKGISELAGLYLSTKALHGRGAEVVVVLDADLKFSNGEESAKSLLNSLIKEFQKNEKTAMVLLHALKRRFSDDDGLAHFWTLAFTEALYGLSFNQSHGGEFAVSREAVSKFFEAQRQKTQPALSVTGVYDFEHLLMLRLAGLIHDGKLDGFLVQHTKVYKDHTETTPEKIFKRMEEELIPRLFETAMADRMYIEAQPHLGKRAYYDEPGLEARYKDKEVRATTFLSIAGTFLRSHFHDLEPLKNLSQHPELAPFLAGIEKSDQRAIESGAQASDYKEFEFNPDFFGHVTRNAITLFAAEQEEEKRKEITRTYMLFVKAAFFDYAATILKGNANALLLDVVKDKRHQPAAAGIKNAMRSEARSAQSGLFQKASGSAELKLLAAGAVIMGIAFLQTVLSLAAFKALLIYVGAAMVGGVFYSAARGVLSDAEKKRARAQKEQFAEREKQHNLRDKIWTALDAWPASAKQNWIEAEESARIPDPDSITDDYARGAIHLKLAGIAFRKHLALGMNAKHISDMISHHLRLALKDFRKVDYDRGAGVLLNALEKLELENTSSSKALELFVEYFILARLRAQPRKAWADAPLPQGGYVFGENPTQAELKNYPLPVQKNTIVFLLPGESKIAFKLKPLYRNLRKNKNNIHFVELKPQDYTSREALIDKIRQTGLKEVDILITPFAGLMPEKQNQYPADLQRYFEDAKDLYELKSGRAIDQIAYETDVVPTLANYFVQGDEQSTRLSVLSMGPGGHNSQRREDKVGIYPGITALMAFVAGTLGWKLGILKDTGAPIMADAFYRTGIYGDERPQQPNEPSKPRRIFLVSPHPDDDVIAAKAILAEAMKLAQEGEVVAEVIVMQPGENGVVDLNETQMSEALRLALGYDTGDLTSASVAQLKKAWVKNLNEIRALHESVLAEYKERYPAAAEKFKAKLETFKGVDFDALFDAAANKVWSSEELAKSGIPRMETKPETEKLLKETAKYFIRRIENQRAIDFFNDAYPGKIRAQFFPEFLGYPSSGPQDLRFIHELEDHAAVVMQHLLMKFERSIKDAPKDAVITIVAPHRVDSHPHHVGSWKVISEAMKLWSTQASRQSARDVEVLYYFAPWSGNLPAYHLSPQTKRSTNADLLRALIAGELTAARFGLPSPKELQTMQAQRYLVRPSILPLPVRQAGARSELRSKRQEKSTKAFIAAAEALKRGDRRRFESERSRLEKLGMLVLAVGNPEFFPENWKTKRPRVYTRAEREEVLRLVTAKVKHTMTPQEKRQLRVTVESQMLAIGEDEVGLIGVQNYVQNESSKFHGAHLQIVSASETVPVDSMMRQTASGFMNMTQYGGAKNLHYQAQHVWWIGTKAFTAKSEKLHGGSYSEVHRFFNPDGSSYIVKTADPRKDEGKLLDEARMIQSLPEDAAAYFPQILKIIETPEKTEVWMEDLQGASLTGLINSAPGMVHMGLQEDFLSFSPFTIARQIYSLLLGVFYMRKQSETPADFAEKYHFSKLEKRWLEAEEKSATFTSWMEASYVKVFDHRGQMHLLPNFRMMLKIFRALAKTYPNYFKPPYLSQQHGDLHFGNILVDIFEIISKKSILVGFKLIDPKWIKEGNDPLYDFAKLLHNLFGHYDLALDHSETHHFRTGRGKSPDAPLEMFDYLDDEASGTMEMLERVRQFEIQTWDFIRTHRGAAFPFEKDPLAWRIRLLFTEASLIAGLFKYHVVNDKFEAKASILYERALTIFNDTLEMFVSFQQDRRLIPTKDKKLRKALEAMILAQNTQDEPAFVKALKEVDVIVSARSEARSIEASTELSRMSSGQARNEAQSFLDWVKTSDFIFRLGRLNQIELLVRDRVDPGEVSLASLLSPTGDGFAFGFDIPPVFHEEGATIINSGLYQALQNRLNGNDDLDALHLAGADMQRRAEIFHAKRRSGFRQGMGHVKGGSQHRQQGKNRSEIRDIPAEAQIFEKAQAEFQFRPFSTKDFKDKIGDEELEDLIRLGVVTETAAGSKMYHLRQFDAKLGWEIQMALGALYSSSDEKLVQKWLEGIYKKERIFDQPQAKLRQASLKEIFNFMARYFRMEKYPAPVLKIFDSYAEEISEADFVSAVQLLERAGIGEFKTKGASAKNQPWFEFIYMPLGQLTAVRAAVQSYDVHHDEARFIQDVQAVLNPVAAPKAQPTAAVVSERDLFEDDARALLTKASGLVKSPEHRVATGNQEPGESAQMRDARVLEVVLVIESRPQILRSVAKLVRAKAPKPLSAEMEADLVKIDTKAEQAERKKARLDQEAAPLPDAIKEALAEREQAAAAALPVVPAMVAAEPKVEVVEKTPTEEMTAAKPEAAVEAVQADVSDPRLRDLPGLRKEFAARTPSDRRSLGAILKSENLDQAFIQLLTAAYRKHYGYMKKVIAEFGFTDHDQLRLLTKELGFDYKTIELEDGDLLRGVEKSQADILKLAQENDWDLPKLQGVLFGGQFYYLGDLIKGLNLTADFKSEVEKRYLAAQGRPFKDKTASFFGLKQDGFNDLVAKLKIELPQITASESSSAPALVNNPAEDHDAALKFLRANDWNITKLVAHIRELVHASGAAAETREYADILKPLNLKPEFSAEFEKRYRARYGYFAGVVKDFGLGQTDGAIRDILKMYEIDPAQIDLKRGDLLTGVGLGKNRAKAKEKLIEKINAKTENQGWDWNLPNILKWAQDYAGGRLNYLQMFKALDIRAEFEAELEATRARTQNADEAAQRFGFKNNSNLKFLLSHLKNDARSEMRGEQPSAVQFMAARLFAAGFLSVEDAVYYLNHREEFLEVLPQLVPVELQKQEAEKLQSILGTDITVKDGVILSSGLVQQGFLAAAEKVFKDIPFAFIAQGEQKTEALKWIEDQGLADRIFIADSVEHAQALLKKHGATRIQGMAIAGETLLGVREIVSFTTGQLQKFYKQAGILGEVQHWAQIFSAFATAA